MKTVFFGTSKYCLPILESLHAHFSLELIITQPDKPFGRKKILAPSPVKQWALEHNISIATPATLKKASHDHANLVNLLLRNPPDLVVVADYGLIIPEDLISVPKMGMFNIHFSKLPDLRGASPVQFTLLRGDNTAWVTVFKLEKALDTGPIFWQKEYPVEPEDTTETLYIRLFQEVARELPLLISKYGQETATNNRLIPQDNSQATYTRLLTKQDGFTEWQTLEKAVRGERLEESELPPIQQEALKMKNPQTAIGKLSVRLRSGQSRALVEGLDNSQLLYSFYKAMTPWPGLWSIHPSGKRLKILKCRMENSKLIPELIQYEGKKPSPSSILNF